MHMQSSAESPKIIPYGIFQTSLLLHSAQASFAGPRVLLDHEFCCITTFVSEPQVQHRGASSA